MIKETNNQLGERMAKLEEKVDGIKGDVADIKAMLQDLDHKFSAKWVEKGAIALVAAIMLGALYAVAQVAGIPIK